MSIPAPPTPAATTRLPDFIRRELAHRAKAQAAVDASDRALAQAGKRMLELGATHLDVVTALRGGVHPEEDDEHSLWWQLEAWGVVSK